MHVFWFADEPDADVTEPREGGEGGDEEVIDDSAAADIQERENAGMCSPLLFFMSQALTRVCSQLAGA